MNYQKIYDSIIAKRKEETYYGYTEKHHIVPRSLGGSDDKDNLVNLTAKEHYICHYLLTKIHIDNRPNFYKMMKALVMMSCSSENQDRHVKNSRQYKWIRENFSEAMRISQDGKGNSQYGTIWICNKSTGNNSKIGKNSTIPLGWERGRITCLEANKEKERLTQRRKLERENKTKETIRKYTEWYKIYNELGFTEFCSKVGYDKSQPNLVKKFARYVDDYVPQNGKPRGKLCR